MIMEKFGQFTQKVINTFLCDLQGGKVLWEAGCPGASSWMTRSSSILSLIKSAILVLFSGFIRLYIINTCLQRTVTVVWKTFNIDNVRD